MATTTRSRNGAADTAPEVTFPVDSFRDAAPHLRRPFTPAAVKFKVQATWPKQNPTGGLIVSYIDARLAVERLNLIVPHLWHDEYEPVGRALVCRLTVDGITRQDVGQEQGGIKGLYSDAFKRAAVKFGIGVSLYATPKMILSTNDGHLKTRRTRDGESLELTPKGESHVRFLYSKWLEAHGVQAFGDPLDHGDVEGAQGDAEVEGEDVEAPAAEQPQPEPVLLPDASVTLVLDAIKRAAMGTQWVRGQLVAVGAQHVPEGAITKGTIQRLTPEQAVEMVKVCDEAAEQKAGQA